MQVFPPVMLWTFHFFIECGLHWLTFGPNLSSIYDAQVRCYTCILVPTVLLHFCYGRQLEVFKGFKFQKGNDLKTILLAF